MQGVPWGKLHSQSVHGQWHSTLSFHSVHADSAHWQCALFHAFAMDVPYIDCRAWVERW